jgi:hypothetical protein
VQGVGRREKKRSVGHITSNILAIRIFLLVMEPSDPALAYTYVHILPGAEHNRPPFDAQEYGFKNFFSSSYHLD